MTSGRSGRALVLFAAMLASCGGPGVATEPSTRPEAGMAPEPTVGSCADSDDPDGGFAPPPQEVLEGDLDDAELIADVSRVSLYEIGSVAIDDGFLYVDDAFFLSPASPAAGFAVPEGRYPVCLRVAEYEGGDERVAFTEVRLSDERVERWELLLSGFGVDSGTGAVAGSGAVRALEAFQRVAFASWSDDMLDALGRNQRGGWTWTEMSVPGSGGNVVAFSTGVGDGGYPVFAGHSADGEVASVMIDFILLPWGWTRRAGEVD